MRTSSSLTGCLNEAGFSRFFTDDAVLLIDGAVRARGPAELARHFSDIKAASNAVTLYPPEDSLVSGDRVFVNYRVTSKAGGKKEAHDVMAAARVAYGRITFFKAISRVCPGSRAC
jgi:ketosteroid isomerase-like protein